MCFAEMRDERHKTQPRKGHDDPIAICGCNDNNNIGCLTSLYEHSAVIDSCGRR